MTDSDLCQNVRTARSEVLDEGDSDGPSWFCRNLGDAMLALDDQDHIERRALEAIGGAESPDRMAVLLRHETRGGLHCEVRVYFSPPLASVAEELGATPCRAPAPGGLSLLVGSPAVLERLVAPDP